MKDKKKILFNVFIFLLYFIIYDRYCQLLLDKICSSKGDKNMRKLRRSAMDASAPIVKPCFVDVKAIWKNTETRRSVSSDLNERVLKALLTPAEKVR